MSRPRIVPFAAAAVLFLGISVMPAHAVNKDMIQLQTQIQDLQNAVAKLQQSNDERMGVLKDLTQQTSDAVNKMSVAVDGMKLQMQNQQEAMGTKTDQISGQIQSLNDTLDELKARMARMEKALGDIQGQQQTGTPSGPASAPIQNATPQPANAAPDPGNLPPTSSVAAPLRSAPPAGSASVGDMYRTAYGDYIAAKYTLAAAEFQDLANAYPDDNLSGNAYFYMGEIDLRTQKPTAAVKMYDRLIEHFPDNVKIPAAHLHKAEALIAMKQNDKATLELHALIQRFPNTPEAATAHTKLVSLGARR